MAQAEVLPADLYTLTEGKYFLIKASASSPDIVVKVGRTEWQEGVSSGSHPLNNSQRIIEDTIAVLTNFKEFVPETRLIKSVNGKGEVVVYIVQDKVYGQRADEIEYSEKVIKQFQIFFDKVIDNYIKYLFYVSGEDEPRSFYPDLNIKNFIWGKVKDDYNIKLYFVDTYPIGGGQPSFIISQVIPTLISRWPIGWREFLKEYAKKFEDRISDYILKNRDKIPAKNSNSLYRN